MGVFLVQDLQSFLVGEFAVLAGYFGLQPIVRKMQLAPTSLLLSLANLLERTPAQTPLVGLETNTHRSRSNT